MSWYTVEVNLVSNTRIEDQILVLVEAVDDMDALGRATELYAKKNEVKGFYTTEVTTWRLTRVGKPRKIIGGLGHGAEVYHRTVQK